MAEEDNRRSFLLSHSEFRSNGSTDLFSRHSLSKIKNYKLDLESLGRLFQNQPKDWGLVGDGYPRVHWKDKRPHERPVGVIIRKVTSSWAEGRAPAKVG
jgi:hypothetical protein